MKLPELERLYKQVTKINQKDIVEDDININQVIKDTLEFINQQQYFINEINEVLDTQEIHTIKRLCRWLQYFNSHYFKNPILSNNSIFAIIKYCKNNELFKVQTQFEFEISLAFYDKIIDSPVLAVTKSQIEAQKLLSISIIHSKYYGMQLSTFNHAKTALYVENSITVFFERLFVKYQSPITLIQRIEHLTLNDLEFLMCYLSGKNPKKLANLDFKITNKELHFMLFQIPESIKIDNNVIEKLSAVAKVINGTTLNNYTVSFFNDNNFFKYRIHDFLDEINFWIKAYSLLSDCMELELILETKDYLDYLEYKKREHGKAYQLNKTTFFH